MGADVADYNNDQLLDIAQVDMTPEDNRRFQSQYGQYESDWLHQNGQMQS